VTGTGELLDRLWARIEARRKDAVELLCDLVHVNSVNPDFPGVSREEVIGGETRVNELLRERYAEAGLETHWVAPDPERKNLVGVRKGPGDGRSLALNGHVDTVPPVEPEAWIAGSPWKPELRDGRLYGFGSTDMTGADTAMWLVAQALEDVGVELEGPGAGDPRRGRLRRRSRPLPAGLGGAAAGPRLRVRPPTSRSPSPGSIPSPTRSRRCTTSWLPLPRIRFLLADDAGAGKTIMADLLLRELELRGLVERTLIVTPAHLCFQ